MLVLTRKHLEKLFIGENICITVVRLGDGQVRLGIDAPRVGKRPSAAHNA
jgi:carbon storage regulator